MEELKLFLILLMLAISYNGIVNSQKTRAELRRRFEAPDFVFDLGKSTPTQGDGGTIQSLTLKELPSLEGEDVSHTLFNLAPCGLNMPHSHPRATEILFVIDAEFLQVCDLLV